MAKHPSEIKLGEIVEALEGSMAPVDCVDDSSICSRTKLCVTHDIWAKIKEAIIGVLNSVTLEDMVKCQETKSDKCKIPMYYI